MRLVAGVLFHLLNWLRGPVLVVLMLFRIFFVLGLLAVLIAFVAAPEQHHTALELLGIALGGSLFCYVVRQSYDSVLHRLSRARYA